MVGCYGIKIINTRSLIDVSRCWLMTDSTSHSKVVNKFFSKCLIFCNYSWWSLYWFHQRFPNPSHPWTIIKRLDFHSMFCPLITSIILSWFNCFSASFSSFSAPIKFEPLSDLKNFTKPLLEINLCSANKNASVDISWASSKCTAQVLRQVKQYSKSFCWCWIQSCESWGFYENWPKINHYWISEWFLINC